MILSDVN